MKLATASTFGNFDVRPSEVFDGNAATTGYRPNQQAYVGVTFANPSVVEFACVVSPSNGFDASGLESEITLFLYAKNGSVPSGPKDGQLLGEIIFTDVNENRSITIQSANRSIFDHAWVVIETGAWCVFAELEFHGFSLVATDQFHEVGSSRHIYKSSIERLFPLTQEMIEVPDFRIKLHLNEPRVVNFDYHGDFVHLGAGYTGVIGCALRIKRRHATTEAGISGLEPVEIPNAVGGCNIIDQSPHHYGQKSICAVEELEAGYHEITILATAHTTGSPLDGLGAIHPGYNLLRVSVEPLGTVLVA